MIYMVKFNKRSMNCILETGNYKSLMKEINEYINEIKYFWI